MKAAAVNGQAHDAPPASPAFDALERQALAIEANLAGVSDPGQAEAAPTIDNAAELLGALQLARLMVKPMFRWWPDFEATWPDATLQAIAEGGGQVMAKHGWTMGGLMNEFGPYIALGVATVPPVMVTLSAIKARKAELSSAPAAPIVASGPDDPPNQ